MIAVLRIALFIGAAACFVNALGLLKGQTEDAALPTSNTPIIVSAVIGAILLVVALRLIGWEERHRPKDDEGRR
jgi:hypothetical protein